MELQKELALMWTCIFIGAVLIIVAFGCIWFLSDNGFVGGDGLEFECNPYTSRDLGRSSCNATLTVLNENVTVFIESNFDVSRVKT